MSKEIFQVSLRITHPLINPDEISKALNLMPEISQCVGELRKTPKGNLLNGTYPDTYWVYKLKNDSETTFSISISEMNKYLIKKSDFIARLADSGGHLEYFIGCFIPSHAGDTLDCKLLEQCALLKIDLAFDMYSDESKEQAI
ncbi:MAG: DUF4279 domain-containing protein [Gammaproteobacteria bacterium]|nr:DUF4279 domain-containing protein [Gammaproteobacteria bacterium]